MFRILATWRELFREIDWRSLKLLLSLALQNRIVFGFAVLSLLATSAAAAVGPALIGKVIDALNQADRHTFLALVYLIVIYEAVRITAAAAHSYLFQRLGASVMRQLRDLVLQRVLRARVVELDRLGIGELTSRVINDLPVLATLFQSGFTQIAERFCIIIAFLLGMVIVSPVVGSGLVILIFSFVLIASYQSAQLYAAYKRERAGTMTLTTRTSELYNLVGLVKYAAREDYEFADFTVMNNTLAAARREPSVRFATLHATMTMVIALGVVVVVLLASLQSLSVALSLSIGTVVALINYLLWLFWPLMHLVNEGNVLLAGATAAKRVGELLDLPQDSSEPSKVNRTVSLAIQLKDLTMKYRAAATPALDGVDLEVNAGALVGIVGASGAGKSTLVRVLLGLYSKDSGEIVINGRILDSSWIAEYQNQVVYLPQELASFGAADLVTEIEKLLDSPPGLLVLDEPAAKLDFTQIKRINAAIDKLKGQTTVIVIAHHLNSIRHFENILVVANGKIVESGEHQSVINSKGIYYKLWELQRQE